MKKSKVLPLVLSCLLVIAVITALYAVTQLNTLSNNIDDMDSEFQNTVDKFVELVFTDPKSASKMALGVVKFNLVNMNEVTGYKIIDTETKLIDSSDDFFRVYERIEYENDGRDHDVVFYYIDFIKNEGSWRAISLIETDPIIKNFESEEVTDSQKEDVKAVFKDFIKEMDRDYKSAEEYLISKAKKAHKASYNFSDHQRQVIKTDIENINIDKVVYYTKDIAITKISYTNNSKEMEVLLNLYRTNKGWRIYDIKQI
ncbi:hypothetical protein [Wukongibacter baidiensis]